MIDRGQWYTTKQGETVDFACWRHYGFTRTVTELVYASDRNLGLVNHGVFLPFGTKIWMPEFRKALADKTLVSLWE
ncbi:MAG: tail protein X [Allorhizobium sp.]